jgi:hypothetical protein
MGKKSGLEWKKYRYGMNIPNHFTESSVRVLGSGCNNLILRCGSEIVLTLDPEWKNSYPVLTSRTHNTVEMSTRRANTHSDAIFDSLIFGNLRLRHFNNKIQYVAHMQVG